MVLIQQLDYAICPNMNSLDRESQYGEMSATVKKYRGTFPNPLFESGVPLRFHTFVHHIEEHLGRRQHA